MVKATHFVPVRDFVAVDAGGRKYRVWQSQKVLVTGEGGEARCVLAGMTYSLNAIEGDGSETVTGLFAHERENDKLEVTATGAVLVPFVEVLF
jgi:hypothetical protein